MYEDLRRYLLNITSEESTSNLIRSINNLAEVITDETIELGVINFLAQVQETDSLSGKTELLALILRWQTNYLSKIGIKVNTVDYYSVDKLDCIIEAISSIENYEDKYTLLNIIDSCEDNVYLIGELTEEITGRIDCYTVLELLDEVDNRTVDLIKDYCQTTTDDILNTPTPNLERLAKLKNDILNNSEELYPIRNYLLNGFKTGLSLKNILAILKNELVEMTTPILLKNIQAAFLMSGSEPSDAMADLNIWANNNLSSRIDVLVEIKKLDFEAIDG